MRLTQADLATWLTYEPDTGVFRWRSNRRGIHSGDVAGSLIYNKGRPRRMLWVDGRRIYAGRAAYIYVHGDIPEGALVDHIDGDALNDRISNLRLASTAQNTWNRIQRDGTKLKLGVGKNTRGRFNARISLPSGKKFFLGTWDTEAEAHACYMGAAAILHADFWVGHRLECGLQESAAAAVLDYDDLADTKRRQA